MQSVKGIQVHGAYAGKCQSVSCALTAAKHQQNTAKLIAACTHQGARQVLILLLHQPLGDWSMRHEQWSAVTKPWRQ